MSNKYEMFSKVDDTVEEADEIMDRQISLRIGQCIRKKRYQTQTFAQELKKKIESENEFLYLNIYKCPHCGKYHLTKNHEKIKRMKRRAYLLNKAERDRQRKEQRRELYLEKRRKEKEEKYLREKWADVIN